MAETNCGLLGRRAYIADMEREQRAKELQWAVVLQARSSQTLWLC
jgi:hypothetical protein